MNEEELENQASPAPKIHRLQDPSLEQFSALKESIKQRLSQSNHLGSLDLMHSYKHSGGYLGSQIRRMTDRTVREATAPRLSKVMEDSQAEEERVYETIEANQGLSPMQKADHL